jgi:hypothetical protein
VSILVTQRPLYVRLVLADGREERIGPFVTGDSAATAAREWLGQTCQGSVVVGVEVTETGGP